MTKNLVKPIERSEIALESLKKAVKISSLKKGKYALSESERAKGYYFLFEGLEVPFRALFNENSKIKGILGICFSSARECPSRALGLCQLPSDKLCYARSGEKRATRRENENGGKGMDSFYNACLSSAFWDIWKEDSDIRVRLFDYLDAKDIHTIRFNLKGDFRDSEDVDIIYHFAQSGYKMVGYTARDDLAPSLEELGNHPKCFLNGSNRAYTNRFRVTADIEDYLNAPFRCLGSCSNCGNCYNLRDKEIVCLVHGNGSDTVLNNEYNRDWLLAELSFLGIGISENDLMQNKGLMSSLNKALKGYFEEFEGFANPKELFEFLENPQMLGVMENGKWGICDILPSECEQTIIQGDSIEDCLNLFIGCHGNPKKLLIEKRGDY